MLDYRALASAAAAQARALEGAGVRPGDRVAVWTDPHVGTPIALAANALAGVVSVPISPAIGSAELAHVLADSRPVLAVAADERSAAGRVPELRVLAVDPARREAAAPRARAVDDAPLLVLYTSGTTGAPKGAVLTARNVASNLDGLADAWAWDERDHLVHALPLFHVHGLVLGLFGTLRRGASSTWAPRFSVEAVADALRRGASMMFGVPTMYHRIADAAEGDAAVRDALRAPRLLVSGSAALPLPLHQKIERLTGRSVVERYGLTETLILCACRHDAPRPGYVGPAVPGVDVRLVDDDRRPLDEAGADDATIGEIAARGPNVFAGYLNRDDATAAMRDADGWTYTGDLATLASDGAFRIVGRRATDLVKTGGFKVGAGEVEAALLEEPSVAEAAVIGVPDDDLGERIVAYVVARDGGPAPAPDRLAAHVGERLAPHKRPREVHVVDALPRNAMGKVQKRALRDAWDAARSRGGDRR